MLKFIKLIHTVIWTVMAAASLYILYAGVVNVFNGLLIFSILIIIFESVILLFNRWTCPLTPLARRYTSENKDNFDIYLPVWLARYNKIIFGTIFGVGLLLVLFNFLFRS
jgi:hypothetical protein